MSGLRRLCSGLLFSRSFIFLCGRFGSVLGGLGLCVLHRFCGGLLFGFGLLLLPGWFRGLFVLSRLGFFLLGWLGLLFMLSGLGLFVLRGF
jgi:hypothetical protein